MQRIIKFRGKRVDNGEWVYGYGVVLDWEFDMANIIHSQGVNRMQCTAVDPATVGQFTGLTDKNGKEIYEGDLVHCIGAPSGKDHAKNYIGKVCWEVIGYHICLWYENEWWSPGRMSYSPDKLEVIGNIYENPELCRNSE